MSQLTKPALQSENQTNFPNNNTGYITPSLLRQFNSDMIESLALQSQVDGISASVVALTAESGTWATTGSNTFNGNQIINGNVSISSSNFLDIGTTRIQDTDNGITVFDSNGGLQIRNFGSSELQIDQNVNADLTITNHLQDIHLYTPSGAVFINDVDFEQYSASVDSRLNNAQGVQGTTGAQGAIGSQGTDGTTGAQGAIGSQGVAGAQGSIGIQGTIGIQGQTGPQGFTGGQGVQGTTGVGAQGAQGITGNDGTQGAIGTQGTQGSTGAGTQGVQGVQGIQGSGANINTASFATTGSNNFIGDQTITGSLLVSSSASNDVTINSRLSVTGPSSGQTPRIIVSGSDNAVTQVGRSSITIDTTSTNINTFESIYAGTGSNSSLYIGVYDLPNANTDIELNIQVDNTGIQFKDWDNGSTFDYVPFMTLAPNVGNNPTPVFTRGLNVTGSVNITGQYLINGTPISGSGGGTAVGAITTGSNGQEQSITGSLGLTTLNNVSAINTLFTASTEPTPMEGTSSAVYFVSYSSVPNGNPNAFSVQADGNWTVSGSGVNNQIVTSVNGDDNGLLYEAGGATFTQGENYVFTAATYYNNLNVNNGLIQLQTDSGNGAAVQVGNNAGDGPYPGFRTVVNSTTNPGNIYSFFGMDDAAGSGLSFGLSLNTYTSFGSGLVGVIYGGGDYNSTTDAIYFVSSSIRMLKPTTFNAPVTFSTPLTASAIRLTGTGTTALQYNQPSTGSVNGVNATYYGKDSFKVYQYQGQKYAFNAYLQTNVMNSYTGSEFQWGLETNGTNSIPGGGSTYFSLMSGSVIDGTGPGATRVGLNYLQTAQCMYFNADTSFARKVYINNGLMVSASAGSNTASVIIDTANPGGGQALQVTGSVNITGSLSVNGNNVIASLAAGAFYSNITQSGSANVSQSMTFNNTDINEGVSVNSNSQLTVTNAGTYNIQFSAQAQATGGADNLYIWLKKNGTNVAASAGNVEIINNQEVIVAWNFVVNANGGDYFELAWQAGNVGTILLAAGASGNIPSIPSVIATVTQVN